LEKIRGNEISHHSLWERSVVMKSHITHFGKDPW